MNSRPNISSRLAANILFAFAALTLSVHTALAQSGKSADSAAAAPSAARPPSVVDRDPSLPVQVQGLEIEEHVGRTLPMELQFTNSEGKKVFLGDYFKDNKPAIIAMVYYKCPVVCDVVMEKLIKSVNQIDFTCGKDFNSLFFSFDSTEAPEEAAKSKIGHLSDYERPITPEIEKGFAFHVGDAQSSRQLADALGFKYRRLENGQFGHPSAIFVITPDGKVSRYYYGFSYPPRDIKLALIDATNGRLVKTLGDRIMSYCYMFDPKAGRYSLAALRVMQVSGVFSALFVASLVGILLVGERIRRKLAGARPATPQDSPSQPDHSEITSPAPGGVA